jgi:ornithine--oxo-acid transaminase
MTLLSHQALAGSLVELEERYAAPIFDPLGVVVASASGAWLTDIDGRRYLDCLSAYSAVNQGHRHPRIIAALLEQAERVTITARALRNTALPRFLERLCTFAEQEMAIPMNTGAEAVETAIKLARRWGYRRKRIPADQAEIIVCDGNFHGRTTTIIGFSPVERYRSDFGPFAPGFRIVPYGDPAALEKAITPNTCAFLVEPIQGEGGIIVPPDGYLTTARTLCRERNVLFIADEIQTGLGRTGMRFAYQYEDAKPDVLILGKALGGGVYPISAVLSSRDVMSTLEPGDHGSTFGGNPLAAAIGIAALDVIEDEHLSERARVAGAHLLERLRAIESPLIGDVRGRGLLLGIELTIPARVLVDALLRRGVAAKDTHGTVIRITPPLIITEEEIEFLVDALEGALADCSEDCTHDPKA